MPAPLYRTLSDNEIIQKARQYSSRTDLNRNSSLYREVNRRGLMQAAFPIPPEMDNTDLATYAKTFIKDHCIETRSELHSQAGALYRLLSARQILNQLLPKVPRLNGENAPSREACMRPTERMHISEQRIIDIASQYASRRELKTLNNDIYLLAVQKNLLKRIFWHPLNWRSSNEQVINHCSSFDTRKDLMLKDPRAYRFARERELLNEVQHANKSKKSTQYCLEQIPVSGFEGATRIEKRTVLPYF